MSYQYSCAGLQLRRVRLLFLHALICICHHVWWEMACRLPPSFFFFSFTPPCSQTYCCLPPLSVFFSPLFFFPLPSLRKGFLIPGMPEKGPLRITLAKPLSLQEIHCLLKKVVGVENQGEVLFFLSFSLFPWKVITVLKKSPFFGTQVFFFFFSQLHFIFHSSSSPPLLAVTPPSPPAFFFFFFTSAGGILEVENLKAGACERGRGDGGGGGCVGAEGIRGGLCAHWEAMLNIQGKCLLF